MTQSTSSTSAPSPTRTVSILRLSNIEYRVHEDPAGLRYGLRRDRLHRLHHQAGLYPHQ